jgi:hypothetical protein
VPPFVMWYGLGMHGPFEVIQQYGPHNTEWAVIDRRDDSIVSRHIKRQRADDRAYRESWSDHTVPGVSNLIIDFMMKSAKLIELVAEYPDVDPRVYIAYTKASHARNRLERGY